MKKSTILFIATLAIITLVAFAPQLVGLARVQQSDMTPMDFVSKLWMKAHKIPEPILSKETFRHIRFVGNATNSTLTINQADSTSIFGSDLKKVKYSIGQDTLTIETSDNTYVEVSTRTGITSISVENTHLSIRSQRYNDTLSVQAKEKSSVYLATARSWNDTTRAALSFLHLDLKEESKANINGLQIGQIRATVDNAALSYNTDLAADTLDATLIGKSIVKSTDAKNSNHVKNLMIRGDKQYFKPELVGQNVLLTLD